MARGYFGREYGVERQVRGGRDCPANGVAALHNRKRTSALFRPRIFCNQRGADGPLTTEEEPFERAPQKEIKCVLRSRRESSENTVAKDDNRKHVNASEAVGEVTEDNTTCGGRND